MSEWIHLNSEADQCSTLCALALDELERHRIHTVSQSRRLGTIGEAMAQMRLAAVANDLVAVRAVGPIILDLATRKGASEHWRYSTTRPPRSSTYKYRGVGGYIPEGWPSCATGILVLVAA